MNRVGVIDIGPSSIRLMLTQIDNTGYFKIIDELKSSIRLCIDLVEDNEICNKNINSIFSTLHSFKSLCTVSGASKIIAIATESFRTAKNKDAIISLIKEKLNIDILVLSCEQEIFYDFIGVKRSMYCKNSLMIEVAGSDTHVVHIKNGEIVQSSTIPFGSVNLTYKYSLNDLISRTDLKNATDAIKEHLIKYPWLSENEFDSLIVIGETARSIGKIDRYKKRYPIDIPHNYKLQDIDVHEVFNRVKSKDLKQRRKIDGIDSEFADIIVGGTTILNTIIEHANAQEVTISTNGLRDGLIYKFIEENYTLNPSILDYSLNGIMNTLNINKSHAQNVYSIVSKLFYELRPLHNLGNEFKNIIKTAALLHDCGISIDYYKHHKHSFYIILNSPINGLTQKEVLMSAAIAASHRFNNYQLPFPQYSSILNQIDLKSINKIGTLIKIAEGLDRSLVGAVKNIDVKFYDESVTIMVSSDINVDLEIQQALRATESFKEIFNKNLIIVQI